MSTTPTWPPDRVFAGDTLRFTYTPPAEYAPSGGWAIAFALAGASTADGTVAADGDTVTVTVTPATTALLQPGLYQWALRASRDGDVFTLERGQLIVAPDVASAADGAMQGWAERTLAVVEAVLTGTVTEAQRSYMIGDTQVVRMSPAELMKLRVQLQREIAGRRTGGRRPGHRVRFTA